MASNKRLNATIIIGGAVASSLKSAFGTTRGEVDKIGQALNKLKDRQKELNRVIADQSKLGRDGSALKVQYANQELEQIGSQIAALRKKNDVLKTQVDIENRIGAAREKYQSQFFGRLGGALALGGLARAPLKSFEDLDAAMNNLEVAFMRSDGAAQSLAEIKKQTIELGNALPGTTADFVNLATALKEQGTSAETIVGGALKSAAHLSVIMKMQPEQAGEMVAKLREAFQLHDAEFTKMSDYVQRAKFAFGMKTDDMLLGAKYYGGKLNSLGIGGAENVRKIYALQGIAAQSGMDGSTFGTNFGQMLTRLGTMNGRLEKNSKEMRAVNADLKEAGIHMEFFDKQGKFAGVDNMVEQLGKLAKLSQEKRLQVLFRLFGEEGSRPADLVARTGVEGFRKALERMDAEASIDQRIDKATTSFQNRIEALTGTVTNLLAAIGEPMAKMLDPVLIKMNEIVGGPLMQWVSENKQLVAGIGLVVAGAAGFLAIGAAISGIGYLSTFAAGGLLTLWRFGGMLVSVMTFLGGTVLPIVANAIIAIGRAALLNPIGLTITALALGAYLVYKNWEPIKKFFVALWADITATFQKSIDWILDKINSVGEFWAKTKAFLGLGDGPAVPAANGGASPALPTPAMAAGRGGVQVNDNSQKTFQIYQQPGQSSQDLAAEIDKLLTKRGQQERRGALYDPAMGY